MKTLALPLLLTLTACAVMEPDEIELSEVEQHVIPKCDDWGCGMNSPYIDSMGFHDLWINGWSNAQGFSISKFQKYSAAFGAWVNYTPVVERGYLRGTSALGTIGGTDLVGARFVIRYQGVDTYYITIKDVNRTLSWAAPGGKQVLLQTYVFYWSKVNPQPPYFAASSWNVCSHPGADSTLGMQEFDTILFEGDQIFSQSKTFGTSTDPRRFNLGCAGGALAKLALGLHTEVGAQFGHVTTRDERQAMLKMVTATYCTRTRPDGSLYGKSFTIGGQPLDWSDHLDWMNYINSSGSLALEARWNASGATCLQTPRLEANPPAVAEPEFDNLSAQIAAECGGSAPPACPFPSAYWYGDGHINSANPH